MLFMPLVFAATAFASTVTGVPPPSADEDTYLARLATCEDSWFSWKDDERRMRQYIDRFNADFTRSDGEPAFLPKKPENVLGFPLVKAYPQSIGMGVGFSVQLGGPFARIRSEVEHRLGKPLECSDSDGMTSCGVELGVNRSLTLMTAGEGADAINLLGCYYYYEK